MTNTTVNYIDAADLAKLQQADEGIILTPSAIARVQAVIKKRGAGIGIRLGAKKSGCSGYKYVLDYVEASNTDDHKFPIDETLAVYVDPESFKVIKGTRIDYVKRGLNEAFEFSNPRNKNTCGCGESFGV